VSLDLTAAVARPAREEAILAGRVAIVYALGNHFLFLPFAALCMAAAILHAEAMVWMDGTPLALLVFASVGANRLKTAYDARDKSDDPRKWAHKFTLYSAFSGAVWGSGAVIWFVPGSFPAQAYLVLAFLGVTATEFVARGAYRPAYFAHAACSLFPLAVLLVVQGEFYAQMTSVLVLFFAGALFTYSGTVERLLDESILLRHDNARLITRLSNEKKGAETARDAAQASERSKSSFISNISHEIRTPLNAILGMAQLLERSDLAKAQRDHVKVLLEAGRGLKILLDDIIALSQFGEEPVNVAPESGCDAGQAARTVVRLLQPNAWEKRLRLTVNVASGLPRGAADPRVLRRILLKLAGNAIKFTERGNVEIVVDSVDVKDGKQKLRFRVTDTGPGIPEHLAATIFEPFARADDSYKRRRNGAGVGLSVARRLVEAMSGEIGVDSVPGQGSTFWITIPAVEITAREVTDAGEQTPPPSGLSILAYLPDSEMRLWLDRTVTPFGNRITSASNLSDTARLAARGTFAAIVTHAGAADSLAAMPRGDTPILSLIRSDERRPDGADSVVRWPAPPSALYSALGFLTGTTSPKNAKSTRLKRRTKAES
jgi:signal transduction histidine kinase